MLRLLRAIKAHLQAISVWSLAGLAAVVLLSVLTVGLWHFATAAQDGGWTAALKSVDTRGASLAAGGIATMLGVAIAALVGYYKFNLFRDGRPHLTIALSASHRQASPRHTHIGATARLANTSKVVITISSCTWHLYGLAPYDPDELQSKADDWRRKAGRDWDEFPWNWIQEPVIAPQKMTIEPGETEEITFDFVIDSLVESVTITLQIPYDQAPVLSETGWSRRIFYDLRATS